MFGKNTVDSVLGALSKAVEDLDVVETKQRNICGTKQNEAAKAQLEADTASEEAARAARVRSKLNELLS